MCKNPRIEPVCDTVTTLNDNAMLVHVEELITSGKSLLSTGFPRVKGYFPGHVKHPRVAYDAL
jgi:hypothetical protein